MTENNSSIDLQPIVVDGKPLLKSKQVFLEDKDIVRSVPGEMHDHDVNFYMGIAEYGKSPQQSYWSAMSDPTFWGTQAKKIDELGKAIPTFFGEAIQQPFRDIANIGKPLEEQVKESKPMVDAGIKIASSLIETFVGRLREPIRQFVGDVVSGETQNLGADVTKAFIDPSSGGKISYRTPFAGFEKADQPLSMTPRAVLGAVEDVLFYGTNFKDIPKMLDNYEINNVKNLMQKNVYKIRENIMKDKGFNEEQATAYMMKPEVQAELYRKAQFQISQQPTKMYTGLPIPEDESLKAMGQSAGQAAKDALGGVVSTPGIVREAAKLTEEILKFKTPEEYVASKGIPVYHGTTSDFKVFDVSKSKDAGIWFSPNKGMAEAYSGDKGKVVEAFVDLKNPYIAKVGESRQDSIEKAMVNGNDGIIVKDENGRVSSLMALDNSAIKTKDQLTQEWQDAQKASSTPPVEPPKTPPVSAAQPEPMPPYKERQFIGSIHDELPQLKVSGQYIPRSTDELATKARNLIKDDIETAIKMAMTGTDDASIATGAELLKHYAEQASLAVDKAVSDALYEKAAELGNNMAVRLTELGRSVQAASILSRLTPEGQIRFAAKTIKKYNEEVEKDSGVFGLRKKIPEITPDQVKYITEKVKEIDRLPPGEEKAIAWKSLRDWISDLVPTPLYQKIITVWKAGLLTGLKTSGLNILSNVSHGMLENAKDLPATIVDSVASLFTKKKTVAFTVKGTPSGVVSGFKKGWNFLKTGYDERDVLGKLEHTKVNFGTGKVAKALQFYEETIFRVLGAEDQVFYYGAKARSIYEQAIVSAKNKGLKGKAVKKHIEELISNPTDDMVALAVGDAETAVFQNNTALSKAAAHIKKIPLAEFIIPFTKTPSAVAMQILRYTPVGGVYKVVTSIGKGKFNQRDFSKDMGRAITGTGLLWLGGYLLNQGLISLDRPTTEGKQKLDEMSGKQANSILFGDKWRTVQVFGPAGNVILIGAQFQDALNKIGSPTGASSVFEANNIALAKSLKSFSQQTFLTGISAAADALSDPLKSADRFTSGLVSSVIPTIIGDVAKSTDPIERRVEGIGDALAAKIPVIRHNLEPQIDLAGKPREVKENFFERMADPSRPKIKQNNPIINEIIRLIDGGAKISTTQVGNKKGYDILTPKQNTELWQSSGSISFDKIANYMQMDSYESKPDEDKAKEINHIIDKAKDVARAEKIIEITQGLEGDELTNKLSKAKKSGLLNRTVLELYKRMR